MRYISLLIIVYLGFSFVSWNFNISTWTPLVRSLSVLIYFVFIGCIEMILVLYEHDKLIDEKLKKEQETSSKKVKMTERFKVDTDRS